MTEIDKMFENAGIKGEWQDYRTKNGKIYEGKNPKNRNIRLCKPRFTAEKQLKLIKLLGKRSNIGLDIFSDNENYFYSDYDGIDGCFEYRADGETFEEALAHIVNVLWQNLTNQEKEEIRKILNDN